MPLTAPLSQAAERIRRTVPDFLGRLAALYADMDRCYADVAARYGLNCRGCTQSCCLTLFYHHTLLEFTALWEAVRRIDAEARSTIRNRAAAYRLALEASAGQAAPFRHPCPLEHDGRCRLYAQRPMICRLHGVPHILHHPVKGAITGPGCHACQISPAEASPLERTSLYAALAGLERSARAAVGFIQPLRLTIADMIIAIPPPGEADSDNLGKAQGTSVSAALQTTRGTE